MVCDHLALWSQRSEAEAVGSRLQCLVRLGMRMMEQKAGRLAMDAGLSPLPPLLSGQTVPPGLAL
jgi:hypothetical protein